MFLGIKYVLIFCEIFVWNISHSKNNGARFDLKKYLLFLSYFNENRIISTDFLKKKIQMRNSINVLPQVA